MIADMRPAERAGEVKEAAQPARSRPRVVADPLPPPPPGPAPGRPPARALRFMKAYWVTFVVIMSYLSVRFQARFRSPESIARILRKKHIRNARRIERISSTDLDLPAPRPSYSVLDTTTFVETFGLTPRPWETALDDVLQRMEAAPVAMAHG